MKLYYYSEPEQSGGIVFIIDQEYLIFNKIPLIYIYTLLEPNIMLKVLLMI